MDEKLAGDEREREQLQALPPVEVRKRRPQSIRQGGGAGRAVAQRPGASVQAGQG